MKRAETGRAGGLDPMVVAAAGATTVAAADRMTETTDATAANATTAADAATAEEAAELLCLLVDAARDYAIFVTDPEGVIRTWNPGVRTITGYEEAEFLGLNCALLFTPEDREAGGPEHERETARREGGARDERWHLRKDGSRFWGSGFMHALYDHQETGTLRGFAKILRDQTAEKRRGEELEEMVRERTAAAAQVKSQAQRQLLTAQEDERRRISRELHDQTGQSLAGLGIELSRIERAADAIRDAAHEAAAKAGEAASATCGVRTFGKAERGIWVQCNGVAVGEPSGSRGVRRGREPPPAGGLRTGGGSDGPSACERHSTVMAESACRLSWTGTSARRIPPRSWGRRGPTGFSPTIPMPGSSRRLQCPASGKTVPPVSGVP